MLGKIRKISPIFHKIEGLWGGRVLSIALLRIIMIVRVC